MLYSLALVVSLFVVVCVKKLLRRRVVEVDSCWGRRSEFSGGWIGKEAECGGAVVFVAAGGAARHQPGPPTRQRHRHGSPPCVRRKQGEALGTNTAGEQLSRHNCHIRFQHNSAGKMGI